MTNTTTFRQLHPHDGSVLDAAATTLLSYFLLRVVQWIATSGFFIIFGKVILIFALSGIVTIIIAPSQSQKGLNGARDIPSKKHV